MNRIQHIAIQNENVYLSGEWETGNQEIRLYTEIIV